MTTLITSAGLCALVYLAICDRPASALRSVVKTASVAILALAALLSATSWMLILALSFCALGDWLLSRERDGPFMAGVAAFAVGHIGYIALFLSDKQAVMSRLSDPPGVAVILLLLIAGTIMARLLGPRAGGLRVPVLAYIPIILGMGVAVLALPAGSWARPAAFAFMASDILLATDRFLLAGDHRARRIIPYLVWPLYWLAQLGFLVAFT